MASPITFKHGATAPQSSTAQTSASPAASEASAAKVAQAANFMFEKEYFEELVDWARGQVDGTWPKGKEVRLCLWDAHSTLPIDFMARLNKIHAEGGNPTIYP
ncbi:MAG: hypothetical protein NTX49_01015 [Chlamydiae bacterium]|nr:hypothetical protein [Chlamydiota bacterium]